MSHATPQPERRSGEPSGDDPTSQPSGSGATARGNDTAHSTDQPPTEQVSYERPGTDPGATGSSRTVSSTTGSSRTDRPDTTAPTTSGYDRAAVVARQKEQFGGMKFGATFFGWLTAAGAGVLLIALLASVGAGIGLSTNINPEQVTAGNAGTTGVISAVVLLVVILVAYFCGGYVAGRMARFNGLKQGIGVWLWAIIAAVVIAVLAAITGSQVDVSRYLDGAPQIPISREALTTSGIIAALAVLVTALVGAVLGGLTGMRYHRRVDRVGENI